MTYRSNIHLISATVCTKGYRQIVIECPADWSDPGHYSVRSSRTANTAKHVKSCRLPSPVIKGRVHRPSHGFPCRGTRSAPSSIRSTGST